MPALKLLAPLAAATLLNGCMSMAPAAQAQERPVSVAAPLTYADLVALAEDAPLVLRVEIADQAVVEPERAPGLAPGHARLYIEAQTTALIAGNAPVGESLRYLVDVPLDGDGDVPDFEERDVILFARPVPGRPGELQLTESDAQFAYHPSLEARLRPILTELVAPDAPPVVTGVRDVLAVPGTLAGESETQLFLETEADGPVSITVVRRPNMAPSWGVSWTEIVDQSARPVEPNTLAWYRLACALPPALPEGANLSRDSQSRALAERDYAYIVEQLGPCTRTRD